MNSQTVVVIGSGTMGEGIAQLAASHGDQVVLIDLDRNLLDRAVANICKQLGRLVEKGRIDTEQRETVIGNIKIQDGYDGLQEVTLAIEAVTEDRAIKQKVFQSLEAATSDDVVLATNTSSLSVSTIAECIKEPSRVVGMHFFNPAPVMPLVEIIAARKSSTGAIDRATRCAARWGKTTVKAKDTPGFIVNRIARGYYLEAMRLLDEGVAGVDEIDSVMRLQLNFRMGPFELMDLVGLDVNLTVSTSVWEQLGKPVRMVPHPIQQQLVRDGHLGRKTRRGFYVHDRNSPFPLPACAVNRRSFNLTPLLSDALRAFCERAGATGLGSTEQYIVGRILGAIINEAALAYGDEVATARDIDIAMTKGTNYPKGPIVWGEEIGYHTVRGTLTALNELCEDHRYEPAELFRP